jgi:hypothetical protein
VPWLGWPGGNERPEPRRSTPSLQTDAIERRAQTVHISHRSPRCGIVSQRPALSRWVGGSQLLRALSRLSVAPARGPAQPQAGPRVYSRGCQGGPQSALNSPFLHKLLRIPQSQVGTWRSWLSAAPLLRPPGQPWESCRHTLTRHPAIAGPDRACHPTALSREVCGPVRSQR